jgi:hypothetical protein
MAGANNVAGSYDSDPQFVIIFVHCLGAMIAAAKAIGCGQASFDRRHQLRVQPIWYGASFRARRRRWQSHALKPPEQMPLGVQRTTRATE